MRFAATSPFTSAGSGRSRRRCSASRPTASAAGCTNTARSSRARPCSTANASATPRRATRLVEASSTIRNPRRHSPPTPPGSSSIGAPELASLTPARNGLGRNQRGSVRHQSARGWHQGTAIRSAAGAGVPTSGAGPGDLKSNSGVSEDALGVARSIDPVFYPGNGKTHANRTRVDSKRFTPNVDACPGTTPTRPRSRVSEYPGKAPCKS